MKKKVLLMLCLVLTVTLFACNEKGNDASDISGQEVSDSAVAKDYETGKQIGTGNMYIAEKTLPSSEKVYAVEKDGKLITGFDFDGFRLYDEGVALMKEGNISEIRGFTGEKTCNTAYRIDKKGKGDVCVLKRYVGDYKDKNKEYAVAKAGKAVKLGSLGEVLTDGEMISGFDFDDYDFTSDNEYIVLKKGGNVTAAFGSDGTSVKEPVYTVEKSADKIHVVVKKNDAGEKSFALAKGGKNIDNTLIGGKLITEFDFDDFKTLNSGYITLSKDGKIVQAHKADGTKDERKAVEIVKGFKVGELYAAVSKTGDNVKYAITAGGEDIGGNVLLGSKAVSEYEFVEVNDCFGVVKAKDADGKYRLFGGDGKSQSISYTKGETYTLAFDREIRMYALQNGKDYKWYVGNRVNDIVEIKEYDEKSVYEKNSKKLFGLLDSVQRAVEKDEVNPDLKGLVSDEIIKEYLNITNSKEAKEHGVEDAMMMAHDEFAQSFAVYSLTSRTEEVKHSYPDGMQGVIYEADASKGIYHVSFNFKLSRGYMITESDGKGGLMITEILSMV